LINVHLSVCVLDCLFDLLSSEADLYLVVELELGGNVDQVLRVSVMDVFEGLLGLLLIVSVLVVFLNQCFKVRELLSKHVVQVTV